MKDRIDYAIKQFESHGIEYSLKTNRQGIFIAVGNLMTNFFNSMHEQEKYLEMTASEAFMH